MSLSPGSRLGPDLAEALREAYIFKTLPSAPVAELASLLVTRELHTGETIARAGEPADGWYMVVSGRARVADRALNAPSLAPFVTAGDAFGERSLLRPEPWPWTIRADVPAVVQVLPRSAYERLTASLSSAEREHLAARIAECEEFEFLRRLRVTSHLSAEDVEALLRAVTSVVCRRGDHLFHEDAPSDSCFIVRRGRLNLLKQAGQSHKQLAVRREGDLVGEVEMLYGTPRIAAALAATDVELLVLDRVLFDRFVPEGPSRAAVFQLASERLLQYQHMLSEAEPAPVRLPDLTVRLTRAGRRWPARLHPFVRAETPEAAGLACLAMVDAVRHREIVWRDRLESLLFERRAQSLAALGRVAEECGYFARMVTPSRGMLRRLDLPVLVEDDDGSIAVLFEAGRSAVTIGNPARGVRRVPVDEFSRWWSGRILAVSAPLDAAESLPVSRHVGALLSAVAAAFVIALFGLAGPLAGKVIVDRVLVNGDRSLLGLIAIGLGIAVLAQWLAAMLRESLLAHATARAAFVLEQRFLRHVMHLPQRVLGSTPAAMLAARFRENAEVVDRAARTGITVVAEGGTVAVYGVALWLINPALAAIAATFAVAYTVVTLVTGRSIERIALRMGEARATFQEHLLEAVSAMTTIKALAVEPLFVGRGRALLARLKAAEFDESRLPTTVALIGSALHMAAMVAMLGYGARLATAGTATTGDLVASLGIFVGLLAPLTALLDARLGRREVINGLARLRTVSSLETEASTSAAMPLALSGRVTFDAVSFRYPGASEDALSDVSFEVLPGQTVAIVGRSGSGKTSLVNLLMGLYPPRAGRIFVDEVDLQSLPAGALRRQLGVVEQHPFLFDGTVRSNIAKGDPTASFERIVEAATIAGLHERILSLPLGYDTPIGERGAALSGGEKQRLMIARALVGGPRLVILDEATSAVDSSAERRIRDNIRRATDGRTTFVIAHRLSTIRDADLILVLDAGRLVEAGTHVELMAARRLYYYLNTGAV